MGAKGTIEIANPVATTITVHWVHNKYPLTGLYIFLLLEEFDSGLKSLCREAAGARSDMSF